MGKIFGISDLPVTIFTTPFQQVKATNYYKTLDIPSFKPALNDTYVSKTSQIKTFVKHFIKGIKK
ncbi:MAG: hypothetical protein MJ230_03735 [bacterium]|nr:hypothetical protein [bacterium]